MENFCEIERKFLVKSEAIPYDISTLPKLEITQGYLTRDPAIRVRSTGDNRFYMTFKGKTEDSLIRREVELPISKNAYETLMKQTALKKIKKNRYLVYENGRKLEIDIFEDNLKGLAFLEVEFKSSKEAEEFRVPAWVEKEVTGDVRYTNSHLAFFPMIHA
ncbi:MAG: CYTH domain-containing protein [Clostridia bacterium]|nr:CYTH domain-containing protein [Clostridia bacterium]